MITFDDKVDLNENEADEINKVTAANLNEIKNEVNAVIDEVDSLIEDPLPAPPKSATLDADISINGNSEHSYQFSNLTGFQVQVDASGNLVLIVGSTSIQVSNLIALIQSALVQFEGATINLLAQSNGSILISGSGGSGNIIIDNGGGAGNVNIGVSGTGKFNLNALTNLPTRSAPASPADGDVWRQDNTNTGLKIRVAGVTKTITLS